MTEPIVGGLHDQESLVASVEDGTAPRWVQDHWETFSAGLTGERNETPFPCFFGAESVRNGDPLYTAVPSMTDRDALFSLGETLLSYLDSYQDHSDREVGGADLGKRGGNTATRASLVAFFKPPEGDLTEAQYHEHLWQILQVLHVHDPEPWPEDIPTDPDDPYWEFCFGGEPMFPTCRAPFYDERMSRYCPIGLEITFQPRALFESLDVTADTPKGKQARDIIQDRLESYDGVCPHADLGDWGVDGDREWPQYMLSSDETQSPDECPINITREHPRSSYQIGAAGD